MKLALWLAVGALTLAAQPKLLVNAVVDTRSAAAGLEREFKALAATQPQPSWIGYSVPVLAGAGLGCELVSPNGWWAPGVVHLEPPDHLVVLFRLESGAVERVRTLSPDCEIDAGGLPLHWLTAVDPSQSVTLLAAMAATSDRAADGALNALALHASPAADSALESLAGAAQPESVRRRAAYWLGAGNGGRRFELLKELLATRPPEAVAQRAISGLAASKAPEAVDFLISIAHGEPNPRIRSQAISALSRKPGSKALDAIVAAIQNDADVQVKRRGVSALQGLADGAGVPLLIQVANSNPTPEVRRQAVTSLSRSKDPRAVAFLLDVLKR